MWSVHRIISTVRNMHTQRIGHRVEAGLKISKVPSSHFWKIWIYSRLRTPKPPFRALRIPKPWHLEAIKTLLVQDSKTKIQPKKPQIWKNHLKEKFTKFQIQMPCALAPCSTQAIRTSADSITQTNRNWGVASTNPVSHTTSWAWAISNQANCSEKAKMCSLRVDSWSTPTNYPVASCRRPLTTIACTTAIPTSERIWFKHNSSIREITSTKLGQNRQN